LCLSNGIDGIVLENFSKGSTPADQVRLIKEIRKFDVNNQLIIVASGCCGQGVQNGAEALEYL